MKAKAIERIAEELGVSFYDLHPLISARDEFHIKEGRREVVEWIETHAVSLSIDQPISFDIKYNDWQDKLKDWGLDEKE